jgi:fatty acid desaturase
MSDDGVRTRGTALGQFYRWTFGIGYERNVGGIERTVRYVLGTAFTLAAVALAVVPVLGTLWNGVLAVACLGTGLYLIYEARVQYCPLNGTLGRSTHRE